MAAARSSSLPGSLDAVSAQPTTRAMLIKFVIFTCFQVDISLNPPKDDVEDHADLSVVSSPDACFVQRRPTAARNLQVLNLNIYQKLVFLFETEKGV